MLSLSVGSLVLQSEDALQVIVLVFRLCAIVHCSVSSSGVLKLLRVVVVVVVVVK